MSTMAPPVTDWIAVARSFLPQIKAARDQTEREGRVPHELIRALAKAGLFRLKLPGAYGGGELDHPTTMQLVEELSYVDAATGVDGQIYTFGGLIHDVAHNLTTVEACDPATGSWSVRAPMPTGRDGRIYVIGGENSLTHSSLTAIEAFDPRTNTWTVRATMPTARAFFDLGSRVG